MGYNVAVCGATGNVGREMLNILAERLFPVDQLTVLAVEDHWEQNVHLAIKLLRQKI